MKRAGALFISESIAVRPSDPTLDIGGSLLIKSTAAIVVRKHGSITTDSLESQQPDMKSRVGIALISENSIINRGALRCASFITQRRGARSIYLVARWVTNNAVIRCDSDIDDNVRICNKYQRIRTAAGGKITKSNELKSMKWIWTNLE